MLQQKIRVHPTYGTNACTIAPLQLTVRSCTQLFPAFFACFFVIRDGENGTGTQIAKACD